jgi:hypothetical protein
MSALENIVFGDKKFSDILEEIYNNQRKKDKHRLYGGDLGGTIDWHNLSNRSPHHRGVRIAIDNFLGEDDNLDICPPLNVRYLQRQMAKPENFFMASYGTKNRTTITPKTMIVWRFLGGHIHVIAFCSNKKDNFEKGGGLFMLSILKAFCERANIPCITLYALKDAEGYYKNKAGFTDVDNITDNPYGVGHQAMVWWNTGFLRGEYNLGLGKVKNHDIPEDDERLNNYINQSIEEGLGFADVVTGMFQMNNDTGIKTRERSRSRDKINYNIRSRSSSGDEKVLEEGEGTSIVNSQGQKIWRFERGGSRRRRKTKKITRRKKTIHKKRKSHKNP